MIGRTRRAFFVAEVKVKPRPASALSRMQRNPLAASEPTIVGCNADVMHKVGIDRAVDAAQRREYLTETPTD